MMEYFIVCVYVDVCIILIFVGINEIMKEIIG